MLSECSPRVGTPMRSTRSARVSDLPCRRRWASLRTGTPRALGSWSRHARISVKSWASVKRDGGIVPGTHAGFGAEAGGAGGEAIAGDATAMAVGVAAMGGATLDAGVAALAY